MTGREQWAVPDGTPLWTTILDTPLETLAFSLHLQGERRNTPFELEIRHACREHLDRSIQRVSTVGTIDSLDFLKNSSRYNRDATVILNYFVTLRPWTLGQSGASVVLGAVELTMVAAKNMTELAIYSPLGLFLAEPDDTYIRDAIIEEMKEHLDNQIIRAVKEFR